MSERKRPAPFSCNCGRRWDGYDQAHCASCHQHFGSVNGFDLHRVGSDGDRHCADPATLAWGPKSKHAGKPRLRASGGPHGVTWVAEVQNSRFRAPAGAGDAAIGNQGALL